MLYLYLSQIGGKRETIHSEGRLLANFRVTVVFLEAGIHGTHMKMNLRRNLLVAILATTSLFMSLLVLQQARTIDSQRQLIRELFRDSLELNAMKMQRVQKKQ